MLHPALLAVDGHSCGSVEGHWGTLSLHG
jgi:hypothetical protein